MKKRIIEQETDMTMKAEIIEDLDQVVEMERLAKADDAAKTRKEPSPTMAGFLDQLLQQGGSWDSIVEQAQAEATKLGFMPRVTKGLITSHFKFRKEKQNKDWAANIKVTEHGIQKKVTSTQEKVAFFAPLIESGKYTADDLVEMSIGQFPKLTESTIRTFLTDSKNPKYNKFDRLVVQAEDGKLAFHAV